MSRSVCRRIADETPHHGRTWPSIAEDCDLAEPRTVQHNRTQRTTRRHACCVFPKPGVAGSIPAGGTTSACMWRFAFRALGPFPCESAELPTFCRRATVRLGETSRVWSGLDVANASRPRSLFLRRLNLARWLHVRVDAARDRDLGAASDGRRTGSLKSRRGVGAAPMSRRTQSDQRGRHVRAR